MKRLQYIADGISWINRAVAKAVCWLAPIMVLVQFLIVLARYLFDAGSVMAQESVLYMFGTLFMLGAGHTLAENGHVRVDIFFNSMGYRSRALVDLAGSLALLTPFCLTIFWLSWPYVADSWSVFETSREVSGLPGVFLFKSVILVGVGLLALQGVALLINSIIAINNHREVVQ